MTAKTTGGEEKIMNDTKSKSLSEAFVNSFGSYPIGYCIGIIVLPMFAGWLQRDPFTGTIFITLIYASVSFVRIYYLRRIFVRFGFDDNLIKTVKKLYTSIQKGSAFKVQLYRDVT